MEGSGRIRKGSERLCKGQGKAAKYTMESSRKGSGRIRKGSERL